MNHLIDGDDGSHHFSPNYHGKEEPEITCCSQCEDSIYTHEAVKDVIGQPICNKKRCIEWSREDCTGGLDGSELIEANKHYDNLLNEVK